ncbi:KAP family P-loop domain-containing protein [Lachnospiraceae bacterium NE2001]|nr:KAP family P-loop domain-containing protein [Lachnospiraceae bacterium NE2001]
MKNIGYPDRPVASINEDLFNVEVYVNALCSFIKNCETPMTISIQGDWGSGKTSMMNMMKANMQGTVWPIWFNTWQFSQFNMGNSLVFSMMDVILKSLDCEVDVRKKILNGLIGFGKRTVRNISDYTLGGELTSVITNSLDGGQPDFDFASEIIDLKNKFVEAVRSKLEKEHKDRVVIFVDDLDRLQPSKAVELLEVLKLFLDCDNCVFVLAVDYEVVTSGIKQKFGNDVSVEKGRSFFDKIIQLPFKMPVASYDIHKYVKEMMECMEVDTNENDVTLFFNLIQNSIGFNPRSMKRLFNTYELLDIVTESTVKNIDDIIRKRVLFAIICTQMSYEKFYLYLTSMRIDEDTFTVLQNDSTLDTALREIYGMAADESLTAEMDKLRKFIPFFISALQVDENRELSEQELYFFMAIIRSSLVTSLKANSQESELNSEEWEYRYKNKSLVKATAEQLKDIGQFTMWMPRKAREGVKFSDISGSYTWNTSVGFDCCLEFYLSRITEYIIGVNINISLKHGKGYEKTFLNVLGDNPLRLSIVPQIEDKGKYTYTNVLRLNANDSSAAKQIASIAISAYTAINETIDEAASR